MSLINEALKQARSQEPQQNQPHRLGTPMVPVYPQAAPPPPAAPGGAGKLRGFLVVLLVVVAAATGGIIFWTSQSTAPAPAAGNRKVAATAPATPEPAAQPAAAKPAPTPAAHPVTGYGKAMQTARETAAKASAAAKEAEQVTAVPTTPAPEPVKPAAPAPVVSVPPMPPPVPAAAGPEANGYKLTGVIGSGTNHMALINDQIVRAGDKVGSATVLSVEATAVVLRLEDKVFELRLPAIK